MRSTRGRPLLVLLILIAAVSALSLLSYLGLRSGLPSAGEIAEFRAPASTRVFDCKGRLVYEFFQEKRRPVPLETIPGYLKDAVIAVEDRRFYSHWGIDLLRIPGVLWAVARRPGSLKGTSTITQQLARSMFLTYRRTLDRKLKEIILAVELEKQYAKDEILEMYLNQIWFGGSVYGVEAAAERYFAKPVSELNLAECATLAAMLANPNTYSPHLHPDRLLQRRNLFLTKLYKTRKLTKAELDAATREPLGTRPPTTSDNRASYFVEEVRRELLGRYGPDFIYRSGSAVHTTLDLDLQEAAERVVEARLAEIEKGYRLRRPKTWFDSVAAVDSPPGPPGYLQGALVAIEVRTGAVRALVGGRDFRQSEYNRATQAKRQAGSAFKPFLFTAAIDKGFTPADIFADSTISIPIPGQPDYEPHNYDSKLLGPVTLRRALALSRNLVAVRLITQVGPELVARYANLMGISSRLPPYYSLALGSVEVTLIDMTRAFTTLASEGTKVRPILVTSVRDNRGALLEENLPETQTVLDSTTVYVVTNMLQSVVEEGTATAIRQVGYEGAAAGKTGTTDDYTDAWFVGYTPTLCTGVWVGYDQKKTIFRGATGGSLAAPLWGEFMKEVMADSGPRSFAPPRDVVTAPICEATGKLATALCPRVRYEVFRKGTEPRTACPVHRSQPRTAPADSFKPRPGSFERH